ncbi:WD40 repeat-like protein [Suillus hirtellus]|nr:WD40 repeat-like protein [Suillus hirtellus]
MPQEEAESSVSTRRGEAPLHSSMNRMSAKEPPPYGAQHRQDALWEGGNEALPPMWQQFMPSSGGAIQYHDDTLTMVSRNRPLPGVRLDNPGDLAVLGWEWHISSLGRSYFVDHNARTTSWKKPKPERPAGSLMPEWVIEGHSECIWSLAYLGSTGNIMSTSDDSSIRQWKGDGEPVGKPLNSDGGGIVSMVVSSDETMVICGSGDGRLRLWDIEEGRMVGDPWEGHDAPVRCLDWSRNSLEIASGSEDGTIRRWNLDTGRQIAPPIETSHGWVMAVKYSPQGDEFMSGGVDGPICIWSKDGKLLIKIKGHENWASSLCWSKDGVHIFSGSGDHTIRKWRAIDGQELVIFRGHTHPVQSLCLTPNESYIVSGSIDCSIRIWDLKTNQAVGHPLLQSHDDRVVAVAISCDGKYIASAGVDKQIYIWNLEAALKNVLGADDGDGRPVQLRGTFDSHLASNQQAKTTELARYANDFFGNESDHASRCVAPAASPLSLVRWRRLLTPIHFGIRPANGSKPIERQSRHRNFNFKSFSGGHSMRTGDVPLAQDEDVSDSSSLQFCPIKIHCIDMASSLKLMWKRLQLWNVRTTRPIVQRNQVNQLGYKAFDVSLPSSFVQPSILYRSKLMPHEEAESSTSTRRGEAPLHSSIYRTSAKYLPPYGAQHRQDALWEGGNEALPPMWQQFMPLSDGAMQYQDDTIMTVSWNRPLPGVRLDDPGDLAVPGWEWHISPLGRSYFVDHNARTTSWKKPKPDRPAGSLMPECVIEGHSRCILSLAYLGSSGNIMSTSDDCSVRQWKGDGEPVGKPLNGDGGGIVSMVVSSDETMVICGSVDGRLRLWNIKEGKMVGDPWEGHNDTVRCLDRSRNSLEIVSGSDDGTIRRWNPDTGRQIAPPIETSHGWVIAVKYSPQGDQFMSSGNGPICIWSKDGRLLIQIQGHENWASSLCWSKDGTYIFSGSGDNTIRKWRAIDGQELVVLRGHTHHVRCICLTPNERYIVSGSNDYSIRIWDLKTNLAVGNPLMHDDELRAVAMSRDGKYIASAGLDNKIYVWNLEAALKNVVGRLAQPRVARPPIQPKKTGLARYGNDFFGNESDHTSRRVAPAASSSSLIHWRRFISSIHFGTRPANASQLMERHSRHWNFNFNLFFGGHSMRTVDVPLAQDEDRYGIVPETDAEAAAAMQRTNTNQANSATQSGQPTGPQPSQVQPIQMQAQGSTNGAEDFVYNGVSCCGFFFGRRRPASHQS